jgi:hypothetical protein
VLLLPPWYSLAHTGARPDHCPGPARGRSGCPISGSGSLLTTYTCSPRPSLVILRSCVRPLSSFQWPSCPPIRRCHADGPATCTNRKHKPPMGQDSCSLSPRWGTVCSEQHLSVRPIRQNPLLTLYRRDQAAKTPTFAGSGSTCNYGWEWTRTWDRLDIQLLGWSESSYGLGWQSKPWKVSTAASAWRVEEAGAPPKARCLPKLDQAVLLGANPEGN